MNTKTKKLTLPRAEIIRGYGTFEKIMNGPLVFSKGTVSFFLKHKSLVYKDPPMNCYKVGFLVSRKKIKSSVKRNRIRRILRELFRLNKYNFPEKILEYCLLISPTKRLYEIEMKTKEITYKFFEPDFLETQKDVNDYLTKE
jgi:ribonuclease P protein component